MAGGIDWFRWHHGTVTDQKFPLIARRSGASVAEVIAVWASLLEAASMNENERGLIAREPDFESMDCALGMADGKAEAIFLAMTTRGLIAADRHITAWPRRQPKREREDNTATERKRNQREREAGAGVTDGNAPHRATSRHATPSHATSRQEAPRGEERRGEKNKELSEQAAQSSPHELLATAICQALREAGIPSVQSHHPLLLALIEAGATATEFLDAVPACTGKRDAFAYLLSVVKGRREDAAREAAAMVRGGFSALPQRLYDRKERQLTVAAVMTGAATAPTRSHSPDTINVESRVIAP